jgi:large subunit ribosomal protein L24e
MADCTFCGKDIPKGTGMIYVFKNGKIANFCSSKCEKHQVKLKHKAREQKWVTSRKEK